MNEKLLIDNLQIESENIRQRYSLEKKSKKVGSLDDSSISPWKNNIFTIETYEKCSLKKIPSKTAGQEKPKTIVNPTRKELESKRYDENGYEAKHMQQKTEEIITEIVNEEPKPITGVSAKLKFILDNIQKLPDMSENHSLPKFKPGETVKKPEKLKILRSMSTYRADVGFSSTRNKAYNEFSLLRPHEFLKNTHQNNTETIHDFFS